MSKLAGIHADIQKYTDAGFIAQPTITFSAFYPENGDIRVSYPVCEKAKILLDLMEAGCLRDDQLDLVEALGFEIRYGDIYRGFEG